MLQSYDVSGAIFNRHYAGASLTRTDAPADPAYAKTIASGLSAVGKTDVVSSGRLIEIQLSKGCDATLPKESVASHTGASLTTLLAHGVLVIRCADRELQCLQSTRDADEVSRRVP